MEFQPIVKHEPIDKRVVRKSQSTDEVGEKHNPLVGFRSRDDPPFIREPVHDVCAKYPASRSFMMSSSMTKETIHLPSALDMFGMTLQRR